MYQNLVIIIVVDSEEMIASLLMRILYQNLVIIIVVDKRR